MTKMGRNPFEEKPQRKRAVVEVPPPSVAAIPSATPKSSFQKLQLQFDVDQFAETIFDGKFSQPIKTVAHMIAALKRST